MNSPMLFPDPKTRVQLPHCPPDLQAEQMEGSPIPDHRERPEPDPDEPPDIENSAPVPDTESEP
mgnify:CR=1 FL=1